MARVVKMDKMEEDIRGQITAMVEFLCGLVIDNLEIIMNGILSHLLDIWEAKVEMEGLAAKVALVEILEK